MDQFKIYCNYGVLAAEKQNVYTYGSPHSTAACSDEMSVKLPENDVFTLYENTFGELMVESKWGFQYEINEVLQGNKTPCFYAIDNNGKGHRVFLEEV